MLFSRMDKAGFAVFHKIAATQGKPFKIYERKGFSQDVKAKEKEKVKEKAKEKAKDNKRKNQEADRWKDTDNEKARGRGSGSGNGSGNGNDGERARSFAPDASDRKREGRASTEREPKASDRERDRFDSEDAASPRRRVQRREPAYEEPDAPRVPASSRLIHQFLPFIFWVLAILIGACLIVVELCHSDMGIGGRFISHFLCGTFGYGAFFIPVAVAYIGTRWHKIVDDARAGLKFLLMLISLVLLSTLIQTIALWSSGGADFRIDKLWNHGQAVGGGVIGGLLRSLLYLMFNNIGTLILVVASLAISLMFLFSLTPKNIWTFFQYRKKLRHERREERAEREAAELARREKLEKEERAALLRRRAREPGEDGSASLSESADLADDSAEDASEDLNKGRYRIRKKEEEAPEKRTPAEDPILSIPKKILEQEDSSDAAPVPTPEPPRPAMAVEEGERDDDGVRLREIFSQNSGHGKTSDGVITIDLPADNAPFKREPIPPAPQAPSPAKTTEEKAPVRAPKNTTVISMKVDTEQLTELENLRSDGADETEPEKPMDYQFPPISLLKEDKNIGDADATAEMKENAAILRDTLASFNIGVRDEIQCSHGPTITRYELRPKEGIRVRSIANLVDDIALSLATSGVRIEAPIPNKPFVGIEVPNHVRLTVYLRTLIENDKFRNDSGKLTACLGADVGGNPVFFDISKMPHLLIAGATGMGKSVCINCIIISLLYKARPDEVKLILIDPKKVEFTIYKDIPHLYAPIVSDPKKAAGALASAVAEMERRFELIEEVGVRDINSYNAAIANDPTKEFLPKMVIVIDELADLMMTAPGEVEASICRLAQKARAAGIHLIVGTQRPSVDVITGLIKANVPSRIACTVSSQVDSRTIIDIAGAERLIGRGDMLFAPVGISKPMRVQGAFVSDGEVEAVVEFIKEHNASAEYNKDFISTMESEAAKCGNKKGGGDSEGGDSSGDADPKFREAVKLAIDAGKISTSLMQRMLGVGYGRAAKILDRMEDLGYISPPDGNKPRRVIITMQEYMEKVVNDEFGPDSDSSED